MSRTLSPLSKNILSRIEKITFGDLEDFYKAFGKQFTKKEIYNTAYRLLGQELIEKHNSNGAEYFKLTEEGKKSLLKYQPKRDGVWKIIVFDIPESRREVRNFIRNRLRSLGFKKWQNSIWVSPYEIHKDLEEELAQLAKKIFIRLIKSTYINYTADLEKLFYQ